MKKRFLSMALAACMIFTMLPSNAFALASQGANSEAETPSSTSAVCGCTDKCTEGAANAACPVCGAEGADFALCTGAEAAPAVCSCTEKCTEGAAAADCPVCSANSADCAGKAADAQPECSCPAGENGEIVHAEGCPLYTAPVAEQTAAEQLMALVDALPNADAITDENREQIQTDFEAVWNAYEALAADGSVTDLDTQLGGERMAKLTALRDALTNSVTYANNSMTETRFGITVTQTSGGAKGFTLGNNISDGFVNIQKAGSYTITGTVNDYTFMQEFFETHPNSIRGLIDVSNQVGGDVTLTLDNLNIKSVYNQTPPLVVSKYGSENPYNVTLVLKGTSTLESGASAAAVMKQGGSGTLTFTGDGTLNAIAGDVAIGASSIRWGETWYAADCNNIVFAMGGTGTVNATNRGDSSPVVGASGIFKGVGDRNRVAKDITIESGTLNLRIQNQKSVPTALLGSGGPYGYAQNITLKGGTVTATCDNPSSGTVYSLGADLTENLSVYILGGHLTGNVPLRQAPNNAIGSGYAYGAYIENAPAVQSVVTQTNGAAYPYTANGMKAAADGKLWFYLPQGNASVQLNGTWYYGMVDNSGNTKLTTAFAPVTAITGMPTTMAAGNTLALNGRVNADATLQNVTAYTVVDAGSTEATLSGNKLTAIKVGTVTVRATVADGKGGGSDYTQDFPITVTFTPVTSITASGMPDTLQNGTALNLNEVGAVVSPAEASYQNIVWSVESGSATLTNNVLTPTAPGPLVLRATVANGAAYGTPFTKDFHLTVPEIHVTGISESFPESLQINETLDLGTAKVAPENASYRTIVWSIKEAGTTGATLTKNKLTASAAGTVTVTATVANGLGSGKAYTKDYAFNVMAASTNRLTINADSVRITSKDDATNTIWYNGLPGGSKDVPKTEPITIFGTGETKNTITVDGTTATIYLQDVNIKAVDAMRIEDVAIDLKNGAALTLFPKGTNTLTADCGIHVAEGNTLVLENGGGTLAATGNDGAGIGGFGTYGKDVAGETGGTITIHGGTVTAIGAFGAGIGGGFGYNGDGGAGGSITITGGTVTATGNYGAGIGGGDGSTAEDGKSGGAGGTIRITGGTIHAESITSKWSNGHAAAIGGGGSNRQGKYVNYIETYATGGAGGSITISGGEVTAVVSASNGAAIGGGGCKDEGRTIGGAGGSITISGGIVNAQSASYGAAIGGGGGYYAVLTGGGEHDGGAGGKITISGGTVTATASSSYQYSSAIGAGCSNYRPGKAAQVTITGGSVNASKPFAASNNQSAAVYCTKVTLDDQIGANQPVPGDASIGGYPYGFQDVRTDASGSLSLYLPVKTGTTATFNGISYAGDVAAKDDNILLRTTAITGTATADGTYGQPLSALVPSGTVKDSDGNTVGGTWQFAQADAANVYPTVGGTAAYTATFTPAENPGSYAPLTVDVTPSMAYLSTEQAAQPSPTPNAAGWYNSVIILTAPNSCTISAADTLPGNWGPTIGQTTEGEGTLTYYLKDDTSGLVAEKTFAYKLDQTAPEIGNLTYDSTQTFWDWIFGKDNIQVTVPVTDALSGADHITYALTPEGGSVAAPVRVAVSGGKATFDVSKEFKGDISILAYDKAENESSAVTTSKMAVEDTAPTLTAKDAATDGKDFTTSWYTTAQTVYITAQDATSGLKSISYTVDDDAKENILFTAQETDGKLTTTAQTYDFSAQEGEHTYHITATDNALNSITVDVTIKQDSKAPAKPTLEVTTAATDTTVTLTATATDATSGVASYTLSGNGTTETSTTGVFALTGLTPGTAYSFTVTATDKLGKTSVASDACSFTTQKAAQAALTITGTPKTITYGDSFTLKAEGGTGNGAVTWAVTSGDTVASVDNTGKVSITGVGEVTITATKAGDTSYKDATATSTFTTVKKALTPTITGTTTKVYDSTTDVLPGQNLAITLNGVLKADEGAVAAATTAYTYNSANVKQANKITATGIALSGDKSGLYQLASTTAEIAGSITAFQPTIAFKEYAPGKTYDGTALNNPTATQMTITGAAYQDVTFTWYKGSVAEANKLSSAPTAAGTYVVVASVQATENTTAASATSAALTISQKALTITANPQTIAYGEGIATGTAQVKCDILAAGDTLTGITLTASGTDVTASGTITPSAAEISSGAENYKITYEPGKLVITKIDPAYTIPTGLTATYGETLAKVALPTAENGTWSWNDSKTSVGNVGENNFPATFTPNDTVNYNTIRNISVAVQVAQADPAIGEVTYAGATLYDSTPVAKVTLTRADTTVPGTLALDGVTELTVGTQSYNWSFTPTDATNYKTVTGKISLTVTADTLQSISVDSTVPSKTAYVYGEKFDTAGLTVTATYAAGGKVDVTSKVTFGDLSVGDTSVTLTYNDGITTKSCTVSGITVAKRQLDVSGMSWSDGAYTYDGEKHSVTLKGTLPEGVAVTKTGDATTNAGSYTATATFSLKAGYDAKNYEIIGTNPLTKDWRIAQASLTITANPQTVRLQSA